MREISAVLSDEIASKLEILSKEMKVSKNTIIERSLREYFSNTEKNMSKKEQKKHFNPVGFGMWKDREDMKEPAQWVRNLRN